MKIAAKREEIMQAALATIAEQGFHASPMDEIAEKAGVAAGTIYRYFESKDVLITEVRRKLEEKINATLREGYPAESPIRERFFFLIGRLIRYFIKHPLDFRYLEQYFNSPFGISLHRDRLLGKSAGPEILVDIFDSGIEQQVLKALPKAVLFSLSFGPLIILTRDHILGFIILDDQMIEQIAGACWDAIKR